MSTGSRLRLGCLPVQRLQWHNRLRRHQAQGWWYLSFVNANKYRDLSFVNVNRAQGWDLSFVNVNKLEVETWHLPVQRSWWHNRMRRHQAQGWWYLSFVNVNRARDWDLAVCWFRGRNDVTNWDATKFQNCNGVWEKSRFHGEKRGNHCHRFNVNVTAEYVWSYHSMDENW